MTPISQFAWKLKPPENFRWKIRRNLPIIFRTCHFGLQKWKFNGKNLTWKNKLEIYIYTSIYRFIPIETQKKHMYLYIYKKMYHHETHMYDRIMINLCIIQTIPTNETTSCTETSDWGHVHFNDWHLQILRIQSFIKGLGERFEKKTPCKLKL